MDKFRIKFVWIFAKKINWYLSENRSWNLLYEKFASYYLFTQLIYIYSSTNEFLIGIEDAFLCISSIAFLLCYAHIASQCFNHGNIFTHKHIFMIVFHSESINFNVTENSNREAMCRFNKTRTRINFCVDSMENSRIANIRKSQRRIHSLCTLHSFMAMFFIYNNFYGQYFVREISHTRQLFINNFSRTKF